MFEASNTFCNTWCWTISRSDCVFVGVASELLDTDADLDDLRRDEEEGMFDVCFFLYVVRLALRDKLKCVFSSAPISLDI